MSATLIYTIYNIAIALIYSIGKKWNDELNKLWVNQLNIWWKYLWIPVLIVLISSGISSLIIAIILKK